MPLIRCKSILHAEWITEEIVRFVRVSTLNGLGNRTAEKAWDDPFVAFARGDDPLFQQLQRDIGPFVWTPEQIFNATFPKFSATPEDLTVISWVLPQTPATLQDQRRQALQPAERWVRSRQYGELFNHKLREHVSLTLTRAGFPAVAPVLSPQWKQHVSGKYGYASAWSERHVAYVAGLGTFGLSGGLITPLGVAVRLGSVVTQLRLPHYAPRPYGDLHAHCLHYSQGTCGKCVERCPAKAISPHGCDKKKCADYIVTVTRPQAQKVYGITTMPCGLCQAGVPCEFCAPQKNPAREA